MRHYFTLVFTLILISCSPENDGTNTTSNTDEPVETKYLPSKITTSEKTTHFSYDNQDRLITSEEKSLENLYSKNFSISYKNNLVDKIILNYQSFDLYSYTNIYTFEYIDNKVIITNQFVDNNSYTVTQSRTIRIDRSNLLITGYGIKTTYDNKKNLIEIADDNTDTKNKFDTKNSIYKNVKTPQWLLYYVLKLGIHKTNNPLEIYTSKTEQDENNSSIISYEYNADDYPIKQFTIDDNYYTIEAQIEYTIK